MVLYGAFKLVFLFHYWYKRSVSCEPFYVRLQIHIDTHSRKSKIVFNADSQKKSNYNRLWRRNFLVCKFVYFSRSRKRYFSFSRSILEIWGIASLLYTNYGLFFIVYGGAFSSRFVRFRSNHPITFLYLIPPHVHSAKVEKLLDRLEYDAASTTHNCVTFHFPILFYILCVHKISCVIKYIGVGEQETWKV